MKNAKGKRRILFTAGIIFAAGFISVFGTIIARAVFDGDTEAVHINPDEIETSTFIIGTYLLGIGKR